MSDAAALASAVQAALTAAAAELNPGALPVSLAVEYLAPGAAGAVTARVARATRTLAFVEAEAAGADGAAVAAGSGVFRLP